MLPPTYVAGKVREGTYDADIVVVLGPVVAYALPRPLSGQFAAEVKVGLLLVLEDQLDKVRREEIDKRDLEDGRGLSI